MRASSGVRYTTRIDKEITVRWSPFWFVPVGYVVLFCVEFCQFFVAFLKWGIAEIREFREFRGVREFREGKMGWG